MGISALLLLLSISCTPADIDDWRRAPERLRFVTPSASGAVVAEQIPILIRVPKRLVEGRTTLTLDGKPVDAGGILRRRWWSGKQADYIGTLSTQGLSKGAHVLTFTLETEDGETWTERRSFVFAPRPDRIVIELTDALGQPRSGRVEFFDMDGVPVHLGSPGDGLADPTERDSVRSSLFIIDGEGQAYLRPGQYQVLASAGIRDGAVVQNIEVPGPKVLQLTVPRLIETPQAVTADLHVHSGFSGDSFVSDQRRWRSLIAGGVEVGVLTEHNRVRDPRPAIALMGLDGHLVMIPGVEFRIGPSGKSIGHGNAFPVQAGEELPQPGDKDPAQVVAGWRAHSAQAGKPALIQLNHPRGIQFWPTKPHQAGAHALFTELGLTSGVPLGQQADPRLYVPAPEDGKRIVDVDALEILNRFSVTGWQAVRQDWFDLMNQGWFVTGTGNSDSHSVELERPGFPVNLVQVNPEDRAKPGALVEAIEQGRVSVSTGPIVQLRVSVDGGDPALPGETIAGPMAHALISVEVFAAPWVPVDEVRIIVDGEVYRRIALEADSANHIVRAQWSGQIPINGDTWVLAEAGWPLNSEQRPQGGAYAKIAPGHVPIGFTNPVRLDADGDGLWTPRLDPNLPSSQPSDTFTREPDAQEK